MILDQIFLFYLDIIYGMNILHGIQNNFPNLILKKDKIANWFILII